MITREKDYHMLFFKLMARLRRSQELWHTLLRLIPAVHTNSLHFKEIAFSSSVGF